MEICNPACSAPCAIISAPTLARHGCIMADWTREFDEPIPVPKGRQLVTLRDAGDYVAELPEAEHMTAEWQAAMFDARRRSQRAHHDGAHRHHEGIESKR